MTGSKTVRMPKADMTPVPQNETNHSSSNEGISMLSENSSSLAADVRATSQFMSLTQFSPDRVRENGEMIVRPATIQTC